MPTTISSCSLTSICPRTTESEIDSMSKVMARITLDAGRWTLEAGQARRELGYRKHSFLAGCESLQAHRLLRDFVRAIGDEERDTALHGVLNLVAERASREIDEYAPAIFT